MNRAPRTLIALALAAPVTPGPMDLGAASRALAQTSVPTAFTYQGRLDFNTQPAAGLHEMRFGVYAASTGGPELAGAQVSNIGVFNGLFNCVVDFGASTAAAFNNGAGRWLQIDVRPQGSNTWTTLPRQQLNSSPYAMRLEGLLRDTAGRWGIGGINAGGDFTIRRQSTASIVVDSGDTTPLEAAYRLADRGTIAWTIQKAADNDFEVYRSSASTPAMVVSHTTGNVGINTASPSSALHVNGRIKTSVLEILGGSDIAEPFNVTTPAGDAAHPPIPGMLVSIDPVAPGSLRLTSASYDRAVAGVISGANGVNTGMVLRQEGDALADGEHPVAMTGRVWAYADADASGPITPGDMLTTSDTPGHAMKAADAHRAHGAVIGKAMTPLNHGRGLVLVLVNLQ